MTSPDQHKPGNRRLDYIGALACAALLLLLLVADHPNGVEIAWVVGCAAALLIALAMLGRVVESAMVGDDRAGAASPGGDQVA